MFPLWYVTTTPGAVMGKESPFEVANMEAHPRRSIDYKPPIPAVPAFAHAV
jgi:hypothetical protein